MLVTGTDGNDELVGSDQRDFIEGLLGDDLIRGGAGDDRLYGDLQRVPFSDSRYVDDNGGVDEIFGGAGMDRIYGGGGADLLSGGPGQDVFVVLAPYMSSVEKPDQLLDFASGIDLIFLSFEIASLSVSQSDSGFAANGEAIVLEGEPTVPFEIRSSSEIIVSDFIFPGDTLIAVDDEVTVAQFFEQSILVLENDAAGYDAANVRIELVNDFVDGDLTLRGNSLRFTPNPRGVDAAYQTGFSYRLVDDRGNASEVAEVTLNVVVPEVGGGTLTGTSGDDVLATTPDSTLLSGLEGNDLLIAQDGNDVLRPGPGQDQISSGGGRDVIEGSLSDLHGDYLLDVSLSDVIRFEGEAFSNDQLTSAGGRYFVSSSDGTDIYFTVGDGVNLLATDTLTGTTSVIAMPKFRALAEGVSLWPSSINGVVARDFLSGRTADTFSVDLEYDFFEAAFQNGLGVYEVAPGGRIVDVRILTTNVFSGGEFFLVEGVEFDHRLGFFLMQDAGRILGASVPSGRAGIVVGDEGAQLTLDGKVMSDLTIFLSHDHRLNVDGAEHVVTGATIDNHGAIAVGFEDLIRDGSSDDDFQDVVFEVNAIVPDPLVI